MSNPNIPSQQPYEHNTDQPERFWTLRRTGALALAGAAIAVLGPRMYAEGAKIAEEHGETYSVAEFWKDTSPGRHQPMPRDGQQIYERTFIVGEDGTWQPGEQGVNDLVGAGLVVGAVAALKRTKHTDKKQANS